jgi:hypothetical protein
MKIVNDLDDLRKTLTPVYSRYPREITPQPAYIEVDLECETVEADFSGEVGNGGTPMRVYHGLVRRVPVTPYARGSALAAFLESEELQKLVERMIDGFESQWDGNNWIGRLTGDATAAEEELANAAETFFPADEHVQVYTVGGWMESSMHTDEDTGEVVLDGVGTITAETTQVELEAMAAAIRESAAKEDIKLESSVLDWLSDLHSACVRQRNSV